MAPPLKRNFKYKQGYFHPENIEKYIGYDIPIYRSGIELDFMRWCDKNTKVKRWGSENIQIPYYDPVKKKNRLYFVDNYVEIYEGNILKKYLIELKDHKETTKPDPRSKKKKTTLLVEQTTWLTNTAKWRESIKFCNKHGFEFLLLAHSKKDGFLPVKLDFLN
jgi:1,4-alpha-glucan branching enzyme